MSPYNPKYNAQKTAYRKEKFKRVGIDFDKEYYENTLEPAALAANQTIAGFIKEAITMRLASDHDED